MRAFFLAAALIAVIASAAAAQTPTFTSTAPAACQSLTPSPSPPSLTFTPTILAGCQSPTSSPSPPTPTFTPTVLAGCQSPTPTASPTPSLPPSPTVLAVCVNAAATPTNTPTAVPADTPTETATATSTSTATDTPIPGADTATPTFTEIPMDTATPTDTATPFGMPTATNTPRVCSGDCDGNGIVTNAECDVCLSYYLSGAAPLSCLACTSGSVVTIDDLAACDASVMGCNTATPTPLATPTPVVAPIVGSCQTTAISWCDATTENFCRVYLNGLLATTLPASAWTPAPTPDCWSAVITAAHGDTCQLECCNYTPTPTWTPTPTPIRVSGAETGRAQDAAVILSPVPTGTPHNTSTVTNTPTATAASTVTPIDMPEADEAMSSDAAAILRPIPTATVPDTATPAPTVTGTITPAIITGLVDLEGRTSRPAGDTANCLGVGNPWTCCTDVAAGTCTSWVIGLHVVLTAHGDLTPVYAFDVTTDAAGAFTLDPVNPGSYDVHLKGATTLQLLWPQPDADVVGVFPSGPLTVNFSGAGGHALYEGDVDGNNFVTLADYTALVASFTTDTYSAAADLNNDGFVALSDAVLLVVHALQTGDS